MRTCLSLISLLLIQLTCTFAQDISSFSKANKYYESEKYTDAILAFEQLLNEEKMHSDEVYYNLGNAYYKITDYPNAILNYERALKLNPNDQDILFNLSLANQKIEDKIDAVPQLFYIKWFQNIRSWFDQDTWALLFIGFLCLSALLLALFIFSKSSGNKKMGFYGSFLTFIISIVILSFAISMHNWQENNREAIVFAGSVSVKSSPVDSGTGLFVVHAGTKVKIIDEIGEWRRVKLADGNEGWLQEVDIEEL